MSPKVANFLGYILRKLNPILFDTDSKTIQKMEKFQNREVSKPKRHTLVMMILTMMRMMMMRPNKGQYKEEKVAQVL